MERYKIVEKNLKAAIKFIKDKSGTPPSYAVKYKDQLKIKGGKLFYNDREVIPQERRDEVLRKELYGKNSTVPYGRDSAFHILKQKYVGLPKNKLMNFIRAQKTLGEVQRNTKTKTKCWKTSEDLRIRD